MIQKPDRKVQVGAGMGGLSALIAWGITVTTGVIIPPEVAIGLSTFLSFVAQYFIPNK
jgi:hypothetical protein